MTNRTPTPRATRELVFARAGNRCQRCGEPITFETFHCSHLRAAASGGTPDPLNLEAWCQLCNLKNGATDVGDPRVGPRQWQEDALNKIIQRIASSGSATVAAAPGAGKTLFAGFVFEALRDADLVDRMVVFVPTRPLVTQWAEALYRGRQLQLKTFSAIGRPDQVGSVVTYHSLMSQEQRDAHAQMAGHRRTFFVFDEVHHLGERPSSGLQPAWARNITELAGDINHLQVAGVLNLSGTLWRSVPSESISTVRYRTLDDGRLQSLVDFEVTTEELVSRGQLRPIDIYRLDSKVRLADYRDLDVIEGNLRDLDEQQTRATIASLGAVSTWRTTFVSAVLDRLERAHRALDGHYVKALIVANRQEHARAFRDEVDKQMRARGLSPLASLAVSDETDAPAVLKHFRAQKKSGVLCTVDMAGEGFDCPEIAVVGYASNKLTALYVRQVIARGMRVTQKERDLGYVIPAAIVLPDAQQLVEQLVSYLKPITHEVLFPDTQVERREGSSSNDPEQLEMLRIPTVRFGLEDATPETQLVTVAYQDQSQEDIDALFSDEFGEELQRLGVPAVFAPRAIAAGRRAERRVRQAKPFDQVTGVPSALAEQVPPDEPVQRESVAAAVTRAPMGEEQALALQQKLRSYAGWWEKNGDKQVPVKQFQSDINAFAGIPPGGRGSASIDQLTKAVNYAKRRIDVHARNHGKPSMN